MTSERAMEPEIPETTQHGYPIVMSKWVPAQLSGWLDGWIIVADISGHNDLHPYAVWWMDERGYCHQGDYCRTLDEATEAFQDRR